MRISKLIKDIENITIYNYKNINIKSLSISDNKCEKGSVFFALPGVKVDGKIFAKNAVDNGAVCVVSDKYIDGINAPQIITPSPRIVLSQIASNFYNCPHKKIKMIAVVGSNGKTTTSHMLYNILKDNGKNVGVIGTLGVFINNVKLPTDMTTPDPIELNYMLSQMVEHGVEYCIMEVSAHAIYLDKVYGIDFECAVYTNISKEHLDFFGTYKKYIDTKLGFFHSNSIKFAVVNSDDIYGRRLIEDIEYDCYTYGLYNPADCFAVNIIKRLESTSFVVNCFDDIGSVKIYLPGEYNVYNALASITVACKLGLSVNECISSLNNIKNISGRMELYKFDKDKLVVIDFAHTPDGYKKVFEHVAHYRTQGKLISLFGFVGYADKQKRIDMINIANKYSDVIVFTSDNPDDVNFDNSSQLLAGMANVKFIEDRERAIEYAMSILSSHDTLLCLGKGGESKQKINGVNYSYCEEDIVNNLIEGYKIDK